MIYRFIFLALLLVSSHQVTAQDIQTLEEDLKNFRYEQVLQKGFFLLEDAYLSREDSLRIYPLMLNAAYALDDTVVAKEIIHGILKTDAGYNPDPRINSPKIIQFFNKHKKRFLAEIQQDVKTDTTQHQTTLRAQKPLPVRAALFSIVLPGSGHLIQDKRQKGFMFSAISGLTLSGIIYASVKTSAYRDDYMNARGDRDYSRLYNRYNDMYRLRNGLTTGYMLYSLYVLYDLFSVHQKPPPVQFRTSLTQPGPAMVLTIRF